MSICHVLRNGPAVCPLQAGIAASRGALGPLRRVKGASCRLLAGWRMQMEIKPRLVHGFGTTPLVGRFSVVASYSGSGAAAWSLHLLHFPLSDNL